MQKEVEADLNLRQKVATFDGYHDFTTHIPQNRISARESIGGRFVEVPYYELSLTEINLACDRHTIDFTLKTAWKPDGGYEFEAYEESSRTHALGETRAIALCNLFVAVMESRLAISSSFKVEANNLRTLSESLNLINSQINSSYDRVEAMLDATKEALIEEIERLKRELESLSRR